MTYGVQQAHGNVSGGEFLTSNLDFFSIWTAVPVAATGVKLPLAEALKILGIANFAGESFNGVTYANDAAYTDALAKQANLDLFIKVFAQRANPVVVSVGAKVTLSDGVTSPAVHPGATNSGNYGSSYNGQTFDEYSIKIVAERTVAWKVGQATPGNVNGYNIEDALSGLDVTDLNSGNILNTDTIVISGNDCNTLFLRSDTL